MEKNKTEEGEKGRVGGCVEGKARIWGTIVKKTSVLKVLSRAEMGTTGPEKEGLQKKKKKTLKENMEGGRQGSEVKGRHQCVPWFDSTKGTLCNLAGVGI